MNLIKGLYSSRFDSRLRMKFATNNFFLMEKVRILLLFSSVLLLIGCEPLCSNSVAISQNGCRDCAEFTLITNEIQMPGCGKATSFSFLNSVRLDYRRLEDRAANVSSWTRIGRANTTTQQKSEGQSTSNSYYM